jgi:hypothetical protein
MLRFTVEGKVFALVNAKVGRFAGTHLNSVKPIRPESTLNQKV